MLRIQFTQRTPGNAQKTGKLPATFPTCSFRHIAGNRYGSPSHLRHQTILFMSGEDRSDSIDFLNQLHRAFPRLKPLMRFTAHRSPLSTRPFPLAPFHSPLATRHSPLATRHSPLTTYCSPLTTHRSPYCTSTHFRYSPLATCSTHAMLSRYQRTVLRMPLSKVSAGFQPSSRWILPASIA